MILLISQMVLMEIHDPDPTDSQAAVDSHGTHVASTIAVK